MLIEYILILLLFYYNKIIYCELSSTAGLTSSASFAFASSSSSLSLALNKECEFDSECRPPNKPGWPNAVCKKNGKCACQSNSIRRASDSHGWVCISLFDAVTGMFGPPLSCPLPDGAGFRVIGKDLENKTIFCKTIDKSLADGWVVDPACPIGYECIKSIGTFSDQWNGVCCPRAERSCQTLPEFNKTDGRLQRWYFNGTKCKKFRWNPETTSSPNTFISKKHCESYCIIN